MGDGAGEQLDMNRQTWAALLEHGVEPGSDLGVDAFFLAPAQASAEALADELRGRGWTVSVSSSRQGVLRRRTLWGLQASRVLGGIGLDVLDDMVVALEADAARHGADFDGWGAGAPGGAP